MTKQKKVELSQKTSKEKPSKCSLQKKNHHCFRRIKGEESVAGICRRLGIAPALYLSL